MLRKGKQLFTSESVSEGHPDKVCDQIADAVLDNCLATDKNSRVACEVMATTDTVVVSGEITSKATLKVEEIVRSVVKDVGYIEENRGFDYKNLKVLKFLQKQSSDIALGVDGSAGIQGAGDQGMMFGYACNETKELMPAPIMFSHRILQKATQKRKNGDIWWLLPDAKAQVTLLYEDSNPVEIDTVVVSHQHDEKISHKEIQETIIEEIIKEALGDTNMLTPKTKYFINPTGRFVIGGPAGDCGMTGRKIIVDTYGGMARHGGGAFSGKDPSKVDRSAAYMARHVAKNIVAWGLANRCEVQLSYAIGIAQPISISVNTYNGDRGGDQAIEQLIAKEFDLTPKGIIDHLSLLETRYKEIVNYGHFGKEGLSWERILKRPSLI
ncbi:MAG: methionine adenosyltransferase [Sphaerochaetaceae bacterium]|nr:methionine adenosyltransferase [Candidatus Cloacimonadota bacterium]